MISVVQMKKLRHREAKLLAEPSVLTTLLCHLSFFSEDLGYSLSIWGNDCWTLGSRLGKAKLTGCQAHVALEAVEHTKQASGKWGWYPGVT